VKRFFFEDYTCAIMVLARSSILGYRLVGTFSRPTLFTIRCRAHWELSPWQYFFLYMAPKPEVSGILSLKKRQPANKEQSAIRYPPFGYLWSYRIKFLFTLEILFPEGRFLPLGVRGSVRALITGTRPGV
jgi:hypothetical protein